MTAGAPALPLPGTILAGRYLLGRPLGKGAMGVVYDAELRRLEQRVAIKVLRPEILAEPGLVARFEREARLIAKLTSDNVVRVIDVDITDDGLPFLVMERLDGTDLHSELRAHGPMPVARAIDLVRQICAGIAEAHRAGVIHRDLKPSNIFVVRRSEPGQPPQEIVKIVDFGVSKLVGDAQLTATESTLGTPRYMSPEQIRSARSVDERTDVWSIAVILFELLAGKPPFYGESATGVAAAIVVDPPLPLRSIRPDVPEWLAQVIEAGLVKNPDRRMPTALAFRAALDPASVSRQPMPTATPVQPMAQAPIVQSAEGWPVVPASPLRAPTPVPPMPEAAMTPSFSVPPGPTEASWATPPTGPIRPVASRANLLLFVALFVLVATGVSAAFIIVRHPSRAASPASSAPSTIVVSTAASDVTTAATSSTTLPLVPSATAVALSAPSDAPSIATKPVAPASTAAPAGSSPVAAVAKPAAPSSQAPSPAPSAKPAGSKPATAKDCPESQKILVGSKLVCP